MARRFVWLVAVAGCASSGGRTTAVTTLSDGSQVHATKAQVAAGREVKAELSCEDPAIVVTSGESMCPIDAVKAGLTVIDLGDEWAPSLLGVQPDGTAPTYRKTYLDLADEKDDDGKALAPTDALAELYGVVPSLAVARARLNDAKRHECRAKVSTAPIAKLAKPYGLDHAKLVATNEKVLAGLTVQLETARKKLNLADIGALATAPGYAKVYGKYATLKEQHDGMVAAEQVLVCEGYLDAKFVDGSMTWRTTDAIELFQRRNFLVPDARLDAETRDALTADSRAQDFQLALRILRERVIDASGLIEDGTAADGPGTVLGMSLDPVEMRGARGADAPLPDGAADLISPATEAAAKALGWTSAADVATWFAAHPKGVRVAVQLPALPAYHGAGMTLSAVVDRGDVWYDDAPKPRKVTHRPTLVLYAESASEPGVKHALIRWPTTIGGWSEVSEEDGTTVQRWKESDVGPRVWRNLYAAPTWLPPTSTPDRDLVKNLYDGHWDAKRLLLGPGPRAAYGMVLFQHEKPLPQDDGTTKWWSNAIGTHGSASVTSIQSGTSHGCHRLYNQLAVRLADFVLRHHEHLARGQQAITYNRQVTAEKTGESFDLDVTTRGFLYELTPPIPVDVTKGNIKSTRQTPPKNAAPASE